MLYIDALKTQIQHGILQHFKNLIIPCCVPQLLDSLLIVCLVPFEPHALPLLDPIPVNVETASMFLNYHAKEVKSGGISLRVCGHHIVCYNVICIRDNHDVVL